MTIDPLKEKLFYTRPGESERRFVEVERDESGKFKKIRCPLSPSRYHEFLIDEIILLGKCGEPYCHQTIQFFREPVQPDIPREIKKTPYKAKVNHQDGEGLKASKTWRKNKPGSPAVEAEIQDTPFVEIETPPWVKEIDQEISEPGDRELGEDSEEKEDSQPSTARVEDSEDKKALHDKYRKNGFVPVLYKGYHPSFNHEKDPDKAYKEAKKPAFIGWNKPDYVAPTFEEITAWEKAGGWVAWKIPEGSIYLDVEDQEDTAEVRSICHLKGIKPGVHCTNKGFHFGFITDKQLSASSIVFTKSGIRLTYRVGGKNCLILAPTNKRRWEAWKDIKELSALPDQLTPYDRKNIDDVLNCLSHSVRTAYREGHFSGYEDLDAAYMALLISCKLSEEMIQGSFRTVFRNEYDERKTTSMYGRTRKRIEDGDPVLGTGTFIQRGKDSHLKEVLRFARELKALTEADRATVNDEWPDPIPFDEYSSLPDFPVDAFSGIGRDMVEAVSSINQVDSALPGSLYLAVLSACCARKAQIDLMSHMEPLNLYPCPVLDSGNRRSSTHSLMTKPLYEYQDVRQKEIRKSISEAQSAFRIKEKRLEKLQRKAAEDEDPKQRQQSEQQAKDLACDMAENPIPKSPIYLVDDVTPEKLGVLMAENGERMAVITSEGGLLEIMAGRYSKDGIGNIEIFLKAHAGDPWSNHRIGREAKTMQAPALTLCLAVQFQVIEEVGKSQHLRGKGLLARFLYSRCRSQVGYRKRQTQSLSSSLVDRYKAHIFRLMDIPITDAVLRVSPEAQRLWDGFYNDIEVEMRPGGSLCYLPDWGSKLPGAVARIAGLLHFAENRAMALSLPISVNSVSASCKIGTYFKEHAIALFGLMQEDRRIKLARQILAYLERVRPETFRGRDIMHHTAISLMEDVEQGLRILTDRGYIREEAGGLNTTGPGRPSGKTYRVNSKIFERKNV